jgi:hypothetical protein
MNDNILGVKNNLNKNNKEIEYFKKNDKIK